MISPLATYCCVRSLHVHVLDRLHEFRAVAAALFPELNASAMSFVDPAAASSLASKSVRTSSDNFASPSTDTTTNSTTDTATDTAVSSRASMVYGGGWQRVLGPRRKTTAPDEGPEVPPVRLLRLSSCFFPTPLPVLRLCVQRYILVLL
jgi:hypothetical protein